MSKQSSALSREHRSQPYLFTSLDLWVARRFGINMANEVFDRHAPLAVTRQLAEVAS